MRNEAVVKVRKIGEQRILGGIVGKYSFARSDLYLPPLGASAKKVSLCRGLEGGPSAARAAGPASRKTPRNGASPGAVSEKAAKRFAFCWVIATMLLRLEESLRPSVP